MARYRKVANRWMKKAGKWVKAGAEAYSAYKTITGKRKRVDTKRPNRGPNAPTKTTTKKKPKRKNIIISKPIGASNSSKVWGYKKKPLSKLYSSISNLQQYQYITTGYLRTGTGVTTGNIQTYKDVGSMYKSTDMTSLWGSWTAGLKATNPFATGYIPGAWQQSQKMYLDNTYQVYEFVNCELTQCTVDFYTVISKVSKGAFVTPGTDWLTGLSDSEGATVTTTTFPGARPQQSKVFNMNWKVMCHETIEMSPGKIHKHYTKFKPHMIIDNEYCNQYAQIKGLTVQHFIVVRGSLIDDQPNQTTDPTNIAYSPVKLIWTVQGCASWKHIATPPRLQLQTTNQLSAAATTTYSAVDQESGLVIVAGASTSAS
nr:MAG: capsid protein [Cressdnaviricota sp.]